MNAIRITQKLESDTLHLPQLREWIGRDVEIIVLDTHPATRGDHETATGAAWVSPLAGSVREYRDPFEPAAEPAEWESIQ